MQGGVWESWTSLVKHRVPEVLSPSPLPMMEVFTYDDIISHSLNIEYFSYFSFFRQELLIYFSMHYQSQSILPISYLQLWNLN